jgi:hypothetical protein
LFSDIPAHCLDSGRAKLPLCHDRSDGERRSISDPDKQNIASLVFAASLGVAAGPCHEGGGCTRFFYLVTLGWRDRVLEKPTERVRLKSNAEPKDILCHC